MYSSHHIGYSGGHQSNTPSRPWYVPRTDAEKKAFQSARDDIKSFLLTCKEGSTPTQIINWLKDHGIDMPGPKFNLTFNQVLFHCQDILETRVFNPRYFSNRTPYLFLNTSAVDREELHILELVRGQMSDKKKGGNPRPTLRNTIPVSPSILLNAAPARVFHDTPSALAVCRRGGRGGHRGGGRLIQPRLNRAAPTGTYGAVSRTPLSSSQGTSSMNTRSSPVRSGYTQQRPLPLQALMAGFRSEDPYSRSSSGSSSDPDDIQIASYGVPRSVLGPFAHMHTSKVEQTTVPTPAVSKSHGQSSGIPQNGGRKLELADLTSFVVPPSPPAGGAKKLELADLTSYVVPPPPPAVIKKLELADLALFESPPPPPAGKKLELADLTSYVAPPPRPAGAKKLELADLTSYVAPPPRPAGAKKLELADLTSYVAPPLPPAGAKKLELADLTSFESPPPPPSGLREPELLDLTVLLGPSTRTSTIGRGRPPCKFSSPGFMDPLSPEPVKRTIDSVDSSQVMSKVVDRLSGFTIDDEAPVSRFFTFGNKRPPYVPPHVDPIIPQKSQIIVDQVARKPVDIEPKIVVDQAARKPIDMEPKILVDQVARKPADIEPKIIVDQTGRSRTPVDIEPKIIVDQTGRSRTPVNIEPKIKPTIDDVPRKPADIQPNVPVDSTGRNPTGVQSKIALDSLAHNSPVGIQRPVTLVSVPHTDVKPASQLQPTVTVHGSACKSTVVPDSYLHPILDISHEGTVQSIKARIAQDSELRNGFNNLIELTVTNVQEADSSLFYVKLKDPGNQVARIEGMLKTYFSVYLNGVAPHKFVKEDIMQSGIYAGIDMARKTWHRVQVMKINKDVAEGDGSLRVFLIDHGKFLDMNCADLRYMKPFHVTGLMRLAYPASLFYQPNEPRMNELSGRFFMKLTTNRDFLCYVRNIEIKDGCPHLKLRFALNLEAVGVPIHPTGVVF